jgi:hypothetical protein
MYRHIMVPLNDSLLRAMLHYIEAFPEKLHHPKQNAYLFRNLREWTDEYDATLDELERQHVEGRELVEELRHSIAAYEADPQGALLVADVGGRVAASSNGGKSFSLVMLKEPGPITGIGAVGKDSLALVGPRGTGISALTQ